MTQSLRVVFAGTPEFAAVALAAIHAAGFHVPLVLTQPDRPAGRGLKLGTINLIGSKEVLRDNILRLKLDVQQFVPMHGNGAVPFADLQKGIEVEHALLDRYDRENRGDQ